MRDWVSAMQLAQTPSPSCAQVKMHPVACQPVQQFQFQKMLSPCKVTLFAEHVCVLITLHQIVSYYFWLKQRFASCTAYFSLSQA